MHASPAAISAANLKCAWCIVATGQTVNWSAGYAQKFPEAAFKARHFLLSPFQLLRGGSLSTDRVCHESMKPQYISSPTPPSPSLARFYDVASPQEGQIPFFMPP